MSDDVQSGEQNSAVAEVVGQLYDSADHHRRPRLFHYTSLSGLVSILESGTIWASELRSLNDASELTAGFDLLADAAQTRLRETPDEARKQLLDWIGHRSRFGPMVFATAFTEAGNLLSQWRGYCPPLGGVSFGVSFSHVETTAATHGFRLGRCIYKRDEQAAHAEELVNVIVDTAKAAGPSDRLPSSQSYHSAFDDQEEHILHWCALMKHAAFEAEAEWRVVSAAHHDYVKGPGTLIRYRPGPSMLVPFVLLPLRDQKGVVPVDEVITGPTPHPERASESTQRCVAQHLKGRHGPWTASYCQIPFRAW